MYSAGQVYVYMLARVILLARLVRYLILSNVINIVLISIAGITGMRVITGTVSTTGMHSITGTCIFGALDYIISGTFIILYATAWRTRFGRSVTSKYINVLLYAII